MPQYWVESLAVWLLVFRWVVCWTLVLPVLLLTWWVVSRRTHRREQPVFACWCCACTPICSYALRCLHLLLSWASDLVHIVMNTMVCLVQNHVGQTCVAAPLSIMIPASVHPLCCWTACIVVVCLWALAAWWPSVATSWIDGVWLSVGGAGKASCCCWTGWVL